MKRLLQMALLATALCSIQAVRAFTYADGDLLLIFRQDGFNDVEFNLGSATNLLKLTSGTVFSVTNFDAAGVKANFNNNLNSTRYIVMAATNATAAVKYAYFTDADATTTPTDSLTISAWKQLQSKVSYVGMQALAATSGNSVEKYVINATDQSSYTYAATDGEGTSVQDVTTIAGLAPFTVENSIIGTSRFIVVTGVNPPTGAPSRQVGSFTMSTNSSGIPALTYTAGSPQVVLVAPSNISITKTGIVTNVKFSSTPGINYRLHYTGTTGLRSAVTSWTSLTSVLATATTTTLQDSNAPGTNRFYKVEGFR